MCGNSITRACVHTEVEVQEMTLDQYLLPFMSVKPHCPNLSLSML